MASLTVAVCVITFRRPELLDGLIGALAPQLERAGARLVVVDNDPQGSAEPVVRCRQGTGVAVQYELETRPGIPVARNRALAAVTDVDLVAFTDDDVRPSAGWLGALVAHQAATGVDVVTGPVHFVFTGPTPRWAAGAHCFRDRVPSSPDPSAWPATNNVLLRRRFLDDHGIAFDEGYELGGGSDTQLFRRIGQAGGTFAWADGAPVDELVPVERSTMAWAVRRSYRTGNTASLCDLEQVGRRASAGPTLRAAGRWTWWGARSAAAAAARFDAAAAVRSLSSLARAGGLVAGLAGARYQEYGRARG